MLVRRFKSFTVAVFSLFFVLFSLQAFAGGGEGEKDGEKKKFNASEVIFGHVLNGYWRQTGYHPTSCHPLFSTERVYQLHVF